MMRPFAFLLVLSMLATAQPAAADHARRAVRKTTDQSRFKSNISGEQLKGLVALLRPDAPSGMRTTTNLADCGAHAGMLGGLVCPGVLSKGQVVLVWDWKSSDKIDGYRIYRVDGTRHDAVGTQAPGEKITLFIVPPPSDGYNGKCYAVAAYQADKESDLSNPACVGSGSVVQTITLAPLHYRATGKSVLRGTGVLGGKDEYNDFARDFEVGYSYSTQVRGAGDIAQNAFVRTGAHFDVGAVAGKQIRSARLKLVVDTTDSGGPADHHTSCASRIENGRDYWWQHTDWIDASPLVEAGVEEGPDASYDVTPLVAAWAGGAGNYGMVLVGDSEDLGVFMSKACSTKYFPDRTQLVIEYQGP